MTQVTSKWILSSKENPLYTTPFGVQLDRTGRLRVVGAEIEYEFNFRFPVYFDNYWSKRELGGATVTHNLNAVSTDLNVGTAINDESIIQTRQFPVYTRGHSRLAYWTGKMNTLKSGLRQRMGCFSNTNGIIFEADGTDLRIRLRTKISGTVVETRVLDRINWTDKLDGTGLSGVTIDLTKQNYFIASYLHLGIGDIVISVIINGEIIEFATISSGNIIDASWGQLGSLPFRFEIKNLTAQGTASTMQISCGSIISEGGSNTKGKVRFTDNAFTAFSVTTTEQSLIAIRLNALYNEASITPILTKLIMPSGNKEIYWKLLFNPTISGGTWSDVPSSIAQENKTVATVSGGLIVGSGHVEVGGVGESQKYDSDIILGSDLDGISDTLVLVMRTTSTTADMLYSMSWREDT